jgi:hypothetical protein
MRHQQDRIRKKIRGAEIVARNPGPSQDVVMTRNPKTGQTVDLDAVREIATSLDGVEVSTSYGVPALKVYGKLMACRAINKSAEPNSLMVRVSFDERDELIAGDPEVYYVTDHYMKHPAVLVRLSKIRRDALEGLLRMSWRFMTTKKSRRTKAGRTS